MVQNALILLCVRNSSWPIIMREIEKVQSLNCKLHVYTILCKNTDVDTQEILRFWREMDRVNRHFNIAQRSRNCMKMSIPSKFKLTYRKFN